MLLSEYVLNNGKDFFDASAGMDLEGVMAKEVNSVYLPGKRSAHWKKIRNIKEADLVICGYQPGKRGNILGALVLGGYRGEMLVYQGKVGTGFSEKEKELLLSKLNPIRDVNTELYALNIDWKNIYRVKPLLVCIVKYSSLTEAGLLRHPVYKGLRHDKSPGDCKTVNTC